KNASPPFRAMKYSSPQPSTDPTAAMKAYRGIRAGCSMESSMSNRSLITGNVSTEESRKEMRNNPGAPNTPAKATIFCFHPIKLGFKKQSFGKSAFSLRAHATFHKLPVSESKDRRWKLPGAASGKPRRQTA